MRDPENLNWQTDTRRVILSRNKILPRIRVYLLQSCLSIW